jgi:uncharacterized protein involved in exopolysaccharide biosynthesis
MQRTEEGGDEFDLFDLLATLWQGRWLIVAVTVLFTAAGVAYALLAVQWFRAEVVMLPAEQQGLGGNLAQLGGLASLAGISIGSPGGDAQTPIAILKSKGFAREFIEQRDLTTVLLQDKWDSTAGRWKESDPRRQPDIRDAVEYFEKKVRQIDEDKKSGLITLGIQWRDPVVAAEWANDLTDRANAKLRARALAEAERNVKFLQEEIKATGVASLQQSMGKVLESEMQKMMLARGSEEYAFKVVDRAVEPRKRALPQRPVVIAASVLLGLLLSAAVQILRSGIRSRNHSRPVSGGR